MRIAFICLSLRFEARHRLFMAYVGQLLIVLCSGVEFDAVQQGS